MIDDIRIGGRGAIPEAGENYRTRKRLGRRSGRSLGSRSSRGQSGYMRRPRSAKAARVAPAALTNRKNWRPNRTARAPLLQQPGVQRSSVHWLLDAVVYARDGDHRNARLAARQALRALGAR